MSKRALVIVVIEDDCHEMLIYRYLKRCGVGRYQIRIERSPSGAGSAEKWVQKTFVKEVTVYRRRHALTKLITVIDADKNTVANRLKQLDDALIENGKKQVDTRAEQIARLVPKRNIETWILCLNEEEVDEETNYKPKRKDWAELTPPASERLTVWIRLPKPPKLCVDSLHHGIQELKRLAL
jgi:hypothetical protein